LFLLFFAVMLAAYAVSVANTAAPATCMTASGSSASSGADPRFGRRFRDLTSLSPAATLIPHRGRRDDCGCCIEN
jgi:hypothetical protein